MSPSQRIVLVALGSWGDVLPYAAIALGLQERGHRPIVVTSACHQTRIEAQGLETRNLRPDSDWVGNAKLMRRRSHPGLGLIRVAHEWLLPALAESYEDIAAAVEVASAVVSHPLAAYAVRLVAEKKRVPWVSTMLVPVGYFSAYDDTVFPLPAPIAAPIRWLSPRTRSFYLRLGQRSTRFLARPWYRLRSQLGLPPATDDNPLGSSISPDLDLALFSKLLADRQPDWPPQTIITGFPLAPVATRLPADLIQFLENGPPPIVFTLGTAVASDAGTFFDVSLGAARATGHRAVFVGSGVPAHIKNGPDVFIASFVPYSELFPCCSIIVQHAGIGTTGLAMRAGRPSLMMPRAWDQPDNAARAERLGIARVISRRNYTVDRVVVELRQLQNEQYSTNANAVREQISSEDGVKVACDAIESLIANSL